MADEEVKSSPANMTSAEENHLYGLLTRFQQAKQEMESDPDRHKDLPVEAIKEIQKRVKLNYATKNAHDKLIGYLGWLAKKYQKMPWEL